MTSLKICIHFMQFMHIVQFAQQQRAFRKCVCLLCSVCVPEICSGYCNLRIYWFRLQLQYFMNSCHFLSSGWNMTVDVLSLWFICCSLSSTLNQQRFTSKEIWEKDRVGEKKESKQARKQEERKKERKKERKRKRTMKTKHDYFKARE